MSQALIDALDALENQVAALAKAIRAADPAAIAHQAEIGAHRGAINATVELSETVRDLSLATTDLRRWAIPAAQMAQETEARRRWWKPLLMALALVLSLLCGSLIGIKLAWSGAHTEAGCTYFGGYWSATSVGKPVCAFYGTP